MDKRLSHSEKTKKRQKRNLKDRHGWNTLDDYNHIYHNYLDNHPFLDHTKPLPEFTYYLSEENKDVYVVLDGYIYCNNDIVVEIKKTFETRIVASGILIIRCILYCYNAYIKANRCILRYDNIDKLSDYHKHTFNSDGQELSRVSITRQQFPLLHEFIDELQKLCIIKSETGI